MAPGQPHKKKTPVGSGRFRSQLGGSWGLNYPRGDFGGCKEPREFREFLLYRTTELPELVITTGLPAFITRVLAV
jgi:hypothetical protein